MYFKTSNLKKVVSLLQMTTFLSLTFSSLGHGVGVNSVEEGNKPVQQQSLQLVEGIGVNTSLKNLNYLEFNDNNLSDDMMDNVLNCIQTSNTTELIKISGNNFNQDYISKIYQVVKDKPNVKQVLIEYNDFTKDLYAKINDPNVKELNYGTHRTDITTNDIMLIYLALKGVKHNLNRLDLSGVKDCNGISVNKIENKELEIVANLLSGNAIPEVDLSGVDSNYSIDSLYILAEAFNCNEGINCILIKQLLPSNIKEIFGSKYAKKAIKNLYGSYLDLESNYDFNNKTFYERISNFDTAPTQLEHDTIQSRNFLSIYILIRKYRYIMQYFNMSEMQNIFVNRESFPKILGSFIENCRSLEGIELRNGAVSDAWVLSISKCLENCNWLRGLSIYKSHLSDLSGQVIFKHLNNLTNIEHITIDENSIGDLSVIEIAKFLKTTTSLRKLSIRNSKVGDEGAIAIGDGVAVNTKLTELDLSNNKINELGAAGLGRGLSVNTVLSKLNLSNNNIGDKGALLISHAISSNDKCKIREIMLDYNNIGNDGAIEIAKLWKSKNSLWDQWGCGLGYNPIGYEGIGAILKILRGFDSRYTFVVCSTYVLDDDQMLKLAHNFVGVKNFYLRFKRNRDYNLISKCNTVISSGCGGIIFD